VTIVDQTPRDDEPALELVRSLLAGRRDRLVAVGAIVALGLLTLALVALGQLGAGPLAPTAPLTTVFIATARTSPTDPAHDVTVVDLSTGRRRTFSVGSQIFDLALSRDRRRLFLASDDGRVFVLDAVRGSVERIVRSASHGAIRYVVPFDDSRLLAVVDATAGSALVLLDVDQGGGGQTLDLGQRVAGRPLVGHEVRLPVAQLTPATAGRDWTGSSVLTISVEPLAILNETRIDAVAQRGVSPYCPILFPGCGIWFTGSAIQFVATVREPPVVLDSSGLQFVFDPANLTVAWLGFGEIKLVDLAQMYLETHASPVLSDASGDAILAADGHVLHVCIGEARPISVDIERVGIRLLARQRYVIPVDTLVPEAVGDDCGSFAVAADGSVVLASEDHLQLLDPRSGAVKRSLQLETYGFRGLR
jgi:hypothetical protein